MILKTLYFGDVTVDEKEVYHFPEGLPGFQNEKSFCLLEADDTPFRFLQSVENKDLCFVVIRIFDFFPNYECKLPDHIVERLEILRPEDVQLMGIVNLRDLLEQSTVNLLAPIVLNQSNHRGQQVILQDQKYLIQTPFIQK